MLVAFLIFLWSFQTSKIKIQVNNWQVLSSILLFWHCWQYFSSPFPFGTRKAEEKCNCFESHSWEFSSIKSLRYKANAPYIGTARNSQWCRGCWSDQLTKSKLCIKVWGNWSMCSRASLTVTDSSVTGAQVLHLPCISNDWICCTKNMSVLTSWLFETKHSLIYWHSKLISTSVFTVKTYMSCQVNFQIYVPRLFKDVNPRLDHSINFWHTKCCQGLKLSHLICPDGLDVKKNRLNIVKHNFHAGHSLKHKTLAQKKRSTIL